MPKFEKLLLDYKEECSFCSELRLLDDNNHFKNLETGLSSRIIEQYDNWVVMPTIGCFVEGYILFVFNYHVKSLIECNHVQLNKLNVLVNKYANKYNNLYKSKYILFEHGSFEEKNSGCCEEHVHLHMLPYNIRLIENIRKFSFTLYEINDFNDLKHYAINEQSSYLFFQDTDCRKYIIFSKESLIPSQFMRQLVSLNINRNLEWDWRKDTYSDNIINTYKHLSEYNNCHDEIF